MKWPFVSRSRYEREQELLERAYAVRTDDLRQRLQSLIDKIVLIKFERYDGQREIAVKVRITDKEKYFFSPFEHREYWWHIGQKITNSLEKEASLHGVEL